MLDNQMSATAVALHQAALVWDNHVCLSFNNLDKWPGDLARFKAGGVKVMSVNIGDSDLPLEGVIRNAARLRAFVRQRPDQLVLAASLDELLVAIGSGRIAIVLDVEGAFSLGDNLDLVQLYYDLGVRWMLMVYNRQNRIGFGVHDTEDTGLTALGRQLVREMDRVGLVKCCSHTGYRTAMDVMTATDRPTIFSHSNAKALCDHPRNITDELMTACAQTGGVVCLTGIGIFLGENDPSVTRLADHIEYVADRIGSEHVGLGLDCLFDHGDLRKLVPNNPGIWPPEYGYALEPRFLPPEALPAVTEELLWRGRGIDEIRGILGDNLLRVAREAWR